MFINFISEVIHATKFFKTPNAEIEKMKTENLTVETLNVTDTATVKNKLTVEKKLVVEEDATIKDVEITHDATVKNDLVVDKNLTVKERATIKNASINTANIDDVHADSKVWTGDVSTLVTDAHEYGLTNQENRNWNGSGSKLSRVNHTHKIPNAIKNPNSFTIYEYSKNAEGHRGKAHTYDGSPKPEGDADRINNNGDMGIVLDYNFVGASPKVHTSTSGSIYGQATDTFFGHVKLYTFDTSELLDEDGNPDIDRISDYTATVSEMGISSGTALTPASLSAYADYMTKYMENTFLKKPANNKPLTVDGNMVIKGDITIQAPGRLFLGNSGVLMGEPSVTDTTDTVILHGKGNPLAARLKLGTGENAPILMSKNDGHLYIDHGDYESKIGDFEIERVITPDSSPHYKKWVPSREGFYRIFMIGGSGYGASGLAIKGSGTPYALSQHGFGIGDAYPGFGGCGGPVVIVDFITKNAPASQVKFKKYRSIPAEYKGTDIVQAKAYFDVTEYNNDNHYSGLITIFECTSGNAVDLSYTSDDVTESYIGAKITSANAIITVTKKITDKEEDSFELEFNETDDSTTDDRKWYVTGYWETPELEFTAFPCSLDGGGTDPETSYILENIRMPMRITFVKRSDDVISGGDDTNEDIDDTEEDNEYAGETDASDGDVDTSDAVDEDNDTNGTGITFTFIQTPAYRSTNEFKRGSNRGTVPRSVGANGFSTVGEIVNPRKTDGPFYGYNVNQLDRVPSGNTNVYTKGNKSKNTDSKDINTSTVNGKNIGYEVFVGHGFDTWTLAKSASLPIVSTSNDDTTYARRPRKLVIDGTSTKYELLTESNPYGVYIYGDPFAGVMHGGTQHLAGTNGWVSIDDVAGFNKSDYTYTVGSGDKAETHYVCRNGYDGGPPGSIGITGPLIDDPDYYKNGGVDGIYDTNTNKSKLGLIRGKGSSGGYSGFSTYQANGTKVAVQIHGGAGSCFVISELDGYSGGFHHSDVTSSSTCLRYPAHNSKIGGYGYYGGGYGGGGAVITRNNGSATYEKMQSAQNGNRVQGEAIVIIAYMGAYTKKNN